MKRAMLPLNLSLLIPEKGQLQRLRPVTSLDIFEGPGGNFHEDGLFSTLTFGRIGDPLRDQRFGYIPLRVPVLHPVMYSRLIRLKGLYGEILSGRGYATFNPELGDFVASTELEGQTGYHFFMSHWAALRPAKTGSSIRDLRVSFFEKYKDQAMMDALLVIPAGLRDAEIDSDGRVSMDDINELYQSVMMTTRSLPAEINPREDLSIYDRSRFTITTKIVAIYDHIETLIAGKKGFIQGRWASRRVFNGTRNVFSSLNTAVADLRAPNRPVFNDTVVGVYQAAKSMLPMVLHALKQSVVGEVFDTTSNQVELVDPTTLKRTWVEISNEEMDRWSTEEGLEKVVNELSVAEKRHRPVKVGEHYLALIYVDDQSHYKILRSLDDLPEDRDPKWVRPLTYVELIYLAAADVWGKGRAFVTRYPVENAYSSFPTRIYVKTTVEGELRYQLDDTWQRNTRSGIAPEFPKLHGEPQYHDSMSVNPSRLAVLGADFDGDTASFSAVYSTEAVKEIDQYFKTRAAYLRAGGGLAFSVNVHTLALTLRAMTGP